jgi:hypothetical protein
MTPSSFLFGALIHPYIPFVVFPITHCQTDATRAHRTKNTMHALTVCQEVGVASNYSFVSEMLNSIRLRFPLATVGVVPWGSAELWSMAGCGMAGRGNPPVAGESTTN